MDFVAIGGRRRVTRQAEREREVKCTRYAGRVSFSYLANNPSTTFVVNASWALDLELGQGVVPVGVVMHTRTMLRFDALAHNLESMDILFSIDR